MFHIFDISHNPGVRNSNRQLVSPVVDVNKHIVSMVLDVVQTVKTKWTYKKSTSCKLSEVTIIDCS